MKPFLRILLFLSIVCMHTELLHAQWIRTNGPNGSVYSFAGSDANLFAGTGSSGSVFRSTNNGTSWTPVFTSLPNTRTDALAISDTNFFAANDVGVFRSTNNGSNWTAAGLTSVYPQALAVSDTNLFAGTFQSGVFRSTNNGASWTAVNNGLVGDALKITVLLSGTDLFAGTWGGGVYRSTNNGTTWIAANTGLTSVNVHAFALSDTNLFAGTYFGSGVYLSTNNGTSWTAVSTGLTNSNVRALAFSGTNLFAGTDGGGVFHSTNSGTNWIAVNTGLTNNVVNALVVSDTYLFAGTGDGVWRRPLSEMITSVQQNNDGGVPKVFALEQNYPNPFNPSTRIRFTLQVAGFTTLKVYDVLGTEVKTLANEELKAGSYETTFDATGLASGVYYYRIQAGSFVETKKLMLLR